MAHFDALPYMDQLDEATEKQVQSLVQAEMRSMGATGVPSDDLSFFFPKDTLRGKELERIARGEKMEQMDLSRYQIRELQEDEVKSMPLDQLESIVHQTQMQLEHQQLRYLNLELLGKFGADAWKLHNYQLESLIRVTEQRLKDVQVQSEEINRERKKTQLEVATVLETMEDDWINLIGQSLQVEMACDALG